MTVEVRNDKAANQYTILEDDKPIGFAVYDITSHEIAFTHTEVDPAQQGKGHAATLVKFALDDVGSTTDLRVVPACSYVEQFVTRHPEYEELTRR